MLFYNCFLTDYFFIFFCFYIYMGHFAQNLCRNFPLNIRISFPFGKTRPSKQKDKSARPNLPGLVSGYFQVRPVAAYVSGLIWSGFNPAKIISGSCGICPESALTLPLLLGRCLFFFRRECLTSFVIAFSSFIDFCCRYFLRQAKPCVG